MRTGHASWVVLPALFKDPHVKVPYHSHSPNIMKRIYTLLPVGLLLFAMTAQAQDMPTPTDLADAKAGECYAQVWQPPQFKTETKRMLKQDAGTRLETIPAVYETVTERMLIKEAGTRLEVIPAQYETVTERVVVKEAGTRLETVPAQYETVTERIQVSPARTVWKTSSGRIYGAAVKDADGNLVTKMSTNGEVLCLVEEPAQYKTVSKRVLKSPATTREVEIPAQYQTVTKRVLKTPATTREIEIPAQYKTITKRVLKSPATTRKIEIPAQYETVTEQVQVSDAKMTWVPVLCEVNVTSAKVREIQGALKKEGHYRGPIDGIFGGGTNTAITAFQRSKGLAQGFGLTLQTLDALQINH